MLSQPVRGLIFATLALTALHCGGATVTPGTGDGGGGDGSVTPGVPDKHRPTAPTCSMSRPPEIVDAGGVDSGIPGSCAVDADCTQGKNGRCSRSMGNRAGNYCTYDACFADGDCAANEACTCATTGNQCVTANCRVDADCGAAGYCSPTTGGSCSGTAVGGFYCHTAGDDCANDADCHTPGHFQAGEACVWAPTSKKWTCQPITICAG